MRRHRKRQATRTHRLDGQDGREGQERLDGKNIDLILARPTYPARPARPAFPALPALTNLQPLAPSQSHQKSTVTLKRANRGPRIVVGRSHVPPDGPFGAVGGSYVWLNAVPRSLLKRL